jgi:putative transposase
MRKARFTEEQMVAIIREADREPVSVVAKRHGISEQTIYTWRKRFGGFQTNDIRRLKQLEVENARLKKLVAERDLKDRDHEGSRRKKLVSVPARRRQVAYSRERGLSARRACTLFKVARSALSYQGRKPVRDASVIERMRELSAQYPRYGYRRIRIFLGRDGYRMSPGRAYRLWRAAGLQLPRKRPKKRLAAARSRPQAPCGPNQVWSYDFVFDHCANGQQLKCLTVTDEFTKEGLAIDVDGRIRSARVIEVLSRLVSTRGTPAFLRSDNGPEFVSKALLSWIVAQGIGTALIEPGKPWQNGVTESFNGKFRDECLSLEWFRSRAEAKVIIETWRRHYNEVRPHSNLGYLTPNEFAAQAARLAPCNATGRGAAVNGASAPRPVAEPSPRGQMQPAREAISS